MAEPGSEPLSDPLFEPLPLPCGVILPNRIAKPAMTECLADPRTNDPNARHEQLYRTWGAGGAGLLVTGNVMVDRRHLERTTNVVLDDRTDPTAVRRWADAAQESGVPTIVQINHPGRQCSVLVNHRPVAPSAVRLRVVSAFATPRALADHEVDELASRYAQVAGQAVAAGFAGVQVHSAHGYLPSQFLSPLANRRTDRWGGPLANRARFLLEVVRRTRAAIGPRAVLSVKLNSSDFQRGGFLPEEAVQVACWLEAEGIDLLEVSGGTYESMALLGMAEGQDPAGDSEAYFLDAAARIRHEVSTPLLLTGGLRTPGVMRGLVAGGTLDMVGVARPLCTDPDLPRRILAGATGAPASHDVRIGFRPLDGMNETGWYGAQIARIADGKQPDAELGRWAGIRGYLGAEIGHSLVRRVGRA